MEKEKQIKEISLILDGCCNNLPDNWCKTYDCSTCKAIQIYNADYRKQIYAENLARHKSREFECSLCHWEDWDLFVADSDYKYCPNCGAKIRG